jgi:hypothetical protein
VLLPSVHASQLIDNTSRAPAFVCKLFSNLPFSRSERISIFVRHGQEEGFPTWKPATGFRTRTSTGRAVHRANINLSIHTFTAQDLVSRPICDQFERKYIQLILLRRPYKSTSIVLCIGPDAEQYHVPYDLLQSPAWLASAHVPAYGSAQGWGALPIMLPDVDKSIGHVLVHYLYTGTYQSLDDLNCSPTEETHIEFRRAVLAYATAKKFELHGLEQLAKEKIEYFGAEMNIHDVVETIKDEYSKLPGDSTWFLDYLKEKARTAFEVDHTIFTKDDFFGRIDDAALTRVLATCVVELYEEKVTRMLDARNQPAPEVLGDCVSEVQDSPFETVTTEECVPVEDTPTSGDEQYILEATAEEALVEEPSELLVEEPTELLIEEPLDEAFPTEDFPVQDIPVEEPVTAEPQLDPSAANSITEAEKGDDGWGFSFGSTGKKSKKKGKNITAETLWDEPVIIEAPQPPQAIPPMYNAFGAVPEPELKEHGWDIFIESAKKKKNSKKGDVVEPALIPVLEPEPEKKEDDDAYFSFGNATKDKKKKKKGSVEEAPPPPPLEPEPMPEPEPIKEDDGWGSAWGATASTKKKKKGKKGLVEEVREEPKVEEPIVEEPLIEESAPPEPEPETIPEPEPVSEPVPEPEPLPEDEPEKKEEDSCDSAWGAIMASKKKGKKGKKGKKDAIVEPVPLEPEPIPELESVQEPEPVLEIEPEKTEDDPWGSALFPSMLNSKKKKGKKVAVVEAVPLEPEPIPELEAVQEPEPALEMESEKTKDDPWGYLGSTASKKKKKVKKAALVEDIPLEPEPVPELESVQEPEPILEIEPEVKEDDTWGNLEATSGKKKKKGKKGAIVESVPLEPEPIPEAHPLLDPEPIQVKFPLCRMCASLCLDEGQWMTCDACRAVMRQVVTHELNNDA